MTVATLSMSTPGAGPSHSRHPTIGSRLNTDGPIPPRLRNSAFLAALSSSAPSISSISIPLSVASPGTELASAFEAYPASRNQSDPTLYHHHHHDASATNASSSHLGNARGTGHTEPHRVQKMTSQQARLHRIAHSRASSMGGGYPALSNPTPFPIVGEDGKSVLRPPTPVPSPLPANTFPFPQRVRSPLSHDAGPEKEDEDGEAGLNIPSMPGLSTSPANISHPSTPLPIPAYPSTSTPSDHLSFDESALDDSSDTDEEFFEFDTPPPSHPSFPVIASSSVSPPLPDLSLPIPPLTLAKPEKQLPSSCLHVPAASLNNLRPRGRSTPSLGRSGEVELEAYFSVPLRAGRGGE